MGEGIWGKCDDVSTPFRESSQCDDAQRRKRSLKQMFVSEYIENSRACFVKGEELLAVVIYPMS